MTSADPMPHRLRDRGRAGGAENTAMARRTPLLMLSLALLAGCGGSGGPATDVRDHKSAAAAAEARPASADFIADAKRICARMVQRLPTLNAAAPPTNKQLLRIIDVWQATAAQLRTLNLPAAEAPRFRRMLTHFDNAIRALRALRATEREEALLAVAVMADQGQKGAAVAYEYGLESCSLFPPAPSQAEFERYIKEQAKREGALLGPPPRARLKPEKRP